MCWLLLSNKCHDSREVAPEQSAEPQRGVREDPGGERPQSLSVEHRDVGRQAVTNLRHETLVSNVVYHPGDNRSMAS